MVLVTHDVDEAVYLGDRVVVMAPQPGRIDSILSVDLPHPRDRDDGVLLHLRNQILRRLEATTPVEVPQPQRQSASIASHLPAIQAAQ